MTPGRKEPTFSSNLGADLQEDARRPSTKGAVPPASDHAPPNAGYSPAPTVVKTSSGAAWFAIFLALGALGLSGFLFWQWTLSQAQLASSEQRIVELEKQLTLSDDEASQSVTALQANIKKANESLSLAHNELRKLWDTRNVNKKAITANKSSIASVKTSIEGTKKALAAQIESVQGAADKVSQRIDSLKTEVTGVAALQDEQNVRLDAVDALERELKALKKQIDDLKAKARAVDSLSRSVKEHGEILQSVDAYRVSTNRQILAIKNRLGGTP